MESICVLLSILSLNRKNIWTSTEEGGSNPSELNQIHRKEL